MSHNWLAEIPEQHHDAARAAVSSVFDSNPVSSSQPVVGGVSGALTYRLEVGGRNYLLRMETRRNSPLRNPHQYTCMGFAAEAEIAPRVHYIDESGGVAIMDFIAQKPMKDYPGGPPALARAMGALIARLQATASFPVLGDYRVFLDR